MGLFTFDPFDKYIKVKGFPHTVDTASSGASTVTVNETIDPDTPQVGLLMIGIVKAVLGCSQDLSGGYDWSGGNSEFIYISTYAGGPEKLFLTANCADLTAVVTHINDRLANGGLINHSESILCQAGDGTPTPVTNIEFVGKSGFEGEVYGLRCHDPTGLSGTSATNTLGLTHGIHVGESDEYSYSSWTGSIFTLDSVTLSETYTVGYSVVANQNAISILDMYNEAMDWTDDPLNAAFDVPMDASGKFGFGSGQYSDSIFRLINSWMIQPAPGFYQQVYTGTVISEVEGDSLTTPATLGAVEVTFRVSTHGVVFEPVTEGMIAEGVWDEPLASHLIAGTSGELMYNLGLTIVYNGLAVSSTNNTVILTNDASSVDGAYDPAEIVIGAGTGMGQTRLILQYDGATRRAVVGRNWKINPDSTSLIIIRGASGREHVHEGLASNGTINTITFGILGSSQNDAYKGQLVFIRSGTGDDQVGFIEAYNGTTKVATVEHNWHTIPDATSAYVVLPFYAHDEDDLAEAIWGEPLADHTTQGTFGAELATKADIGASTSTDYTFASSGTIINGSLGAGTYASTFVRDGSYWQIDEDAVNGITVEMTFYLPSIDHRAGVIDVYGRYLGTPSQSHYQELWAYNYESITWEQLVESFMEGGITSDDDFVHEYYERHIDRTNNNEVQIRIVHNVTTYNATHDLFLDYVSVSSIEIITASDIAEAVWDSLRADNQVVGSFGEALHEIYQVELGRWKFDDTAKTLTIYDADDSTPMAVFDMKDIGGSPTLTNIYERVRQ